MNKAVLVVDMPDNCMECRFCRELYENVEACCEMMDDPDDNTLCGIIDCRYGHRHQKPDWCPLRKLPEKESSDLLYDTFDNGYGFG